MVQEMIQQFKALYGHDPRVFRSPGRVNLIGEHTDYNDGFVLPAAINRELYFCLAPNGLERTRVYSFDLRKNAEFRLNELEPSSEQWQNYLLGVLAQFSKRGIDLPNFDVVYGGNVPIGAGMSSSAAVECGLAYGLNEVFGLGLDRFTLARMGQKAEHEYARVMSGIMDQFANLFGRKEHVVKLDCRSLEYEYYPFDMSRYHIVLCDTRVKHSLASSEYNNRRKECEEGVSILSRFDAGIRNLRDVTPEFLEQHREELPPIVYRRCFYVVHETRRVLDACRDLRNNDLAAFGKKMYQTHDGLRQDYEVSCEELDFLVDEARKHDAVIGARMMGGGFGGCTINLVLKEATEAFVREISEAYYRQFHVRPETYITAIVDGTSEIPL
ncbi:MAG TPA: galactokinase [Sphingobacteriaceae bacterium]